MTTPDPSAAHGAHLVGSVPLASAEAVFQAVAGAIGDRLRRIPDGETGPRADWIVWELQVVLDEVPHDQLAVQWDTNFEFGMLEGVFPVWFEDVKGGILERLLRISRRVPPDIELGYHFCYGDVQHRHFKEPGDAGRLVEVANALTASLGRPLHWIHLPVPRGRDDEAYY